MRTLLYCLLATRLIACSTSMTAQTGDAANDKQADEKEKLLRKLKSISADSSIVYPLARYVESELTTIYTFIRSGESKDAREMEKAERSLVYFIRELSGNIQRRKHAYYNFPGDIEAYKNILRGLLAHAPLLPLLQPLDKRRSQLMATSFSQYKEYSLLDDVAVYKRVASSPEFILQFLESKPDFRFADSLLSAAAAHDPLKLVYYLKKDRSRLAARIRSSSNIYLRQITLLADDKNAAELLPFVKQLAESTITTDTVIETRTDALRYFQLMINTLEGQQPREPVSVFEEPLRSGIRQKAFSFYVNEVNSLHDATEAVRFAAVKNLRIQDIYYIITTCGDELYTSSYLGLYKRLMERFIDQPVDSLFDMVKFDHFRVFIRLAANYNVLIDFLGRLSPEKREEILNRFITGIEKDENIALEGAMDIADCFSAIGADSVITGQVEEVLESNLGRCKTDHQFLGIRLYGILSDMLRLVKQKEGLDAMWALLGDYDQLKRESLVNKNGEIVELVLFYGDEDGVASFGNFLRLYSDNSKWKVEKNKNWVTIRSVADPSLVVYANLPLDIKEEKDSKAQDSLFAYLKESSLEPVVLVHRGHSYHLDKTLNRLTASVRLAILGSCGGYNRTISIAAINPEVQVIGSKKMGSKSINDPLIDMINRTLYSKKDISWPEIWKKLADRFSKDENTLSLFNEYFPPSDNLGLFVLKLFNYDGRYIRF
ncbi:MAG: hypothetical protein ABIR30_00170 [Chitinophagaceae bacterium]